MARHPEDITSVNHPDYVPERFSFLEATDVSENFDWSNHIEINVESPDVQNRIEKVLDQLSTTAKGQALIKACSEKCDGKLPVEGTVWDRSHFNPFTEKVGLSSADMGANDQRFTKILTEEMIHAADPALTSGAVVKDLGLSSTWAAASSVFSGNWGDIEKAVSDAQMNNGTFITTYEVPANYAKNNVLAEFGIPRDSHYGQYAIPSNAAEHQAGQVMQAAATPIQMPKTSNPHAQKYLAALARPDNDGLSHSPDQPVENASTQVTDALDVNIKVLLDGELPAPSVPSSNDSADRSRYT